jgi:hypothetical protein
MAHSVIFAGLDVHTAQTHAAQLEAATGELSVTRLAGGCAPTIAWLRRVGPGVVAVTEAGPPGSDSRGQRVRRGSICGS